MKHLLWVFWVFWGIKMANFCQQVLKLPDGPGSYYTCGILLYYRSNNSIQCPASVPRLLYVLSRAAALQTRVPTQPMRGKNEEVNLSVSTDRYSFKTVSNNSSVYHNISSPYRFTHVFLSNFLIILCYFGNIVCRLWTISFILVPCLKTVLKL